MDRLIVYSDPTGQSSEDVHGQNRIRDRFGRLPLLLLLLVASLLGCSSGTTQSPSVERAHLVLADLALQPEAPASGFYIVGVMRGGHFVPEGEVQGEGEFGDEGHPGWLELRDLTFHGDETGRPPFPPYVRGYLGADDIFRPASRRVNY